MARKFTRGRGRLGSRRETSWVFIAPTRTTLVAVGGTILASGNAALLGKRPFTIIRTHLYVSWVSDQVIADEAFGGAVGMCVVSDQASAIGASAVPTPVADIGSDLWFLHRFYSGGFAFLSSVGFDSAPVQSFQVDSKAARKVNDDEDPLVVAEFSSVFGGGGSVINVAGRFLIKES